MRRTRLETKQVARHHAHWRTLGALTVGLSAIAVVALPAGTAGAATQVVTNCSGSPTTPGSLPYEAAAAASGDTITFALSPACSLITVVSPVPIAGLTIDGPGAGNLAVSGGGTTGVFLNGPDPSATATLTGLTVEDGNAATGNGGAVVNDGTLTVGEITFADDTTSDYGGAIYNDGTLTVTESTFSGDAAPGAGFGGGAIFSDGSASISASTFSGNSSGNLGGAILNLGGDLTIGNSTFSGDSAAGSGGAMFNTGTAGITNSTFSANRAVTGGGVESDGTLTIGASLLAGSSATGGNCYLGGSVHDQGYNLDDGVTCGFGAAGDLSDVPAVLDPSGLRNNGGPTPTIALFPGSPAIKHVTDASLCPSTDQRGSPRGLPCDIGAFDTSVNPYGPIVSTVSPFTDFTTGGTPITITGSGFTGVTAVDFGSVPSTDVTFSSDGSITAVSPPGAAGVVDLTVTTLAGTSAITAADEFTYTVKTAPTTATCTPSCTATVASPLDGVSVAVSGTSTSGPASISLVTNTATLNCGSQFNYPSPVSTLKPAGFGTSDVLTITQVVHGLPSTAGVKVCYQPKLTTPPVFLKLCGPRKIAPCLISLVEQNDAVTVKFLTPAKDPKWRVGTAYVLFNSATPFTPVSGIRGSKVTIKGSNLTPVTHVIFGGATATISSHTATQIVAVVPQNAQTGLITLTGNTGSVASPTQFKVT